MKVDGVLAGRKIVKVELESDPWSLLPQDDSAYVLALGIFEFDFSFSRAGQCGDG